MSWFKRSLGKSNKKVSKPTLKKEETPVKDLPVFLAHKELLENHYKFLIQDFGFKLTLNDWVSYEYTTIYKKENIEVFIMFTTDPSSSVSIINTDLEYNESKNITNEDLIGPCTPESAKVVLDRLKKGLGVIKTPYNT